MLKDLFRLVYYILLAILLPNNRIKFFLTIKSNVYNSLSKRLHKFFFFSFQMMKISAAVFFIVIHLVVNGHKFGLTCSSSEFSCPNSKLCVPLDRYCDGRDDCGDKSDEPKDCTGKQHFFFTHLCRRNRLVVSRCESTPCDFSF